MIDLRPEIQKALNPKVIDSIRRAPKPTPVAEVLAVAREFGGKALSLDEIAEIVNLSDPGKTPRAKAANYHAQEIVKHPELLLVRTPRETLVRLNTAPLRL